MRSACAHHVDDSSVEEEGTRRTCTEYTGVDGSILLL
jgi:hypothetical protein